MPATGILGGSFNPPHRGHLALARHARAQLGLERVLLMPLHTPAHKHGGEDPGPAHRLAMCALAAAGEQGIEASALEVERGGASYTADTLSEIHARDPEAQLTFIVGADTALTLPAWQRPGTVLSLARLAVAGRPGSDERRLLDVLTEIPVGDRDASHAKPDVVFLSMAPVEVSSSLVRERLAAAAPVGGMIEESVAGYIAEHRLYTGTR